MLKRSLIVWNILKRESLNEQFQESKRTFLHNIVNEEGEKGKLEFFLNFCEDTIFEVGSAAPPGGATVSLTSGVVVASILRV